MATRPGCRFRTRPSQNLFRRRRHNPQPESSSNPANLPPILQPKLHLLLSRTPKRVPDLSTRTHSNPHSAAT
ncbi:hypothetical protein NC651_012439 [Populus alba x Populus x berolinensis]|nr:hypothetical protein NC651_012439 [Populus alba x Populus x berolinensis]